MNKKHEPETEMRNVLEVETDNTDKTESLPCHLNLLVMFAWKSFINKEIEDFQIWAVRRDAAIEESTQDSYIFAYKRVESSKDDSGWCCLLVPSEKQKVFSESTSPAIVPETHVFSDYFKIYTNLKRDPDIITYLKRIDKIVLCCYHSPLLKVSYNITNESLEEDFILDTRLLQMKDDFRGKKELVEEMIKLCPTLVEHQNEEAFATESHLSHLRLDMQEFIRKVAFVTDCPSWEDLNAFSDIMLRQYSSISDSGNIRERLMKKARGLTGKKDAQSVILCHELKDLFEEVKAERGKRAILRFNLSDPVSDFVGRERQLREMHLLLGGKPWCHKDGPCKYLVLSGLGGMGKSELARKYCKRHFISLYDNIIWIDAENPEGIWACLQSLAFRELQIEKLNHCGGMKDISTVVDEIFDQLRGQRTLLIYDNAESFQEIKRYLPSNATNCHIHVILTSRFQHWQDMPLILLDNFDPVEAFGLVKRYLDQMSSWNDDNGQELCQILSYYPLALKQAVSYIQGQYIPTEKEKDHISAFIFRLKESTESMLDHTMCEEAKHGYGETTFKILMNTVQLLKTSLQGQMALTLLNIISYLSPDCIDFAVMSNVLPKYSQEVIENGFTVLSKLSVVSFVGSKVRIHRLVQTVNRIRLRSLGSEANVLREAMHYALEMDVRHSISVWGFLSNYADLVKEFSWVPSKIIMALLPVCHDDTILKFSESALPLLIAHFGTFSVEVMEIEVLMVLPYFSKGSYDEAEKFIKKYLKKWSKTSNCNPEFYFLGKFLYGCLLEAKMKNDESLSIFKEIVSESKIVMFDSMYISLCELRIANLMLKMGVPNDEEWKNIEQWSRKAYISIRTEVEMVGTIPGRNNCILTQIKHRGNMTEDIFMVMACFHMLPEKNGKWEEAYEVIKWCLGNFSEADSFSQFITRRGTLYLSKILMKIGKFELALNELKTLSSKLKDEHDENYLFEYNCLLSKVLCLLGRYTEAFPIVLGLCFNTERNALITGGLMNFLCVIDDIFNSGNFEEVYHLMVELFLMTERNVGKNEMPLFFLKASFQISHKLYKFKKLEAIGILKSVYQFSKLKVGERHTITLFLKAIFARFYLGFGKRSTLKKGVSHMQEVEKILLSRFLEGDPQVKLLLEMVEDDLSYCKLMSQKPSEIYKSFSFLISGNCEHCKMKF